MGAERLDEELGAALAAADDASIDPAERAEMLMEMAMGLQQRPPTPEHLEGAVRLYQRALELCPDDEPLLAARVRARRATALQITPAEDTRHLEAARDDYRAALPAITAGGSPAEVAELEMNLGLVLQSLSAHGKARLTDAIAAYQRSLRTFDRAGFPKEFAILQNNLATAFLSIPLSDERGRMREALAVQAFEEALKVVTLVDHPVEYAMLQNNLGNALQYASSSHLVENNLRALEAYDEALRVRTRRAMPVAYANTMANRANCLWNLPDDPADPERGNARNLVLARAAYAEAREVFASHGEPERARQTGEALVEIEREILAQAQAETPTSPGNPL